MHNQNLFEFLKLENILELALEYWKTHEHTGGITAVDNKLFLRWLINQSDEDGFQAFLQEYPVEVPTNLILELAREEDLFNIFDVDEVAREIRIRKSVNEIFPDDEIISAARDLGVAKVFTADDIIEYAQANLTIDQIFADDEIQAWVRKKFDVHDVFSDGEIKDAAEGL